MMQSARNIKLIGSSIIAIILAAGYFLVVTPILDSRQEIGDTVVDSSNSIESLTQQVATLQQSSANYDATLAKDQTVSVAIPSTEDSVSFRNQINDAANRAGLNPNSISNVAVEPAVVSTSTAPAEAAPEAVDGEETPATTAPTGNQSLAESSVVITASGTIESLSSFAREITGMQRAFLIDNIQFVSTEDDEAMITITGKIFLYAPINVPISPAELAAQQAAPEAVLDAVPVPETVPSTETPVVQ